MIAGTVLCGVDDSPEALDAVHMAAALTARLGLRLVLAHPLELRRGESRAATQERAAACEDLLVDLADGLPSPAAADLRVEFGDPAEVLAQLAAEEGADLIVVGSHRRRGRDRRLHCPLARELEAITPVPVLVSPPQTRRRSARRLALATASR